MEITITINIDDVEVEKLKKTIKDDQKSYSCYARFFDECCYPKWSKSAEENLYFLRCVETYFTEKLRIDGYVFLNDVYYELGLPRTKAGQIVGWVYDEKNPIGDNRINFGIFDDTPINREFINGYENTILLDFNVDGNILDKIK